MAAITPSLHPDLKTNYFDYLFCGASPIVGGVIDRYLGLNGGVHKGEGLRSDYLCTQQNATSQTTGLANHKAVSDILPDVRKSRKKTGNESRTEPGQAGPSGGEPRQAERGRTEANQAEPGHAERSQLKPSRSEPSSAESSQLEPSRSGTSRAELGRAR